MQKLIVLGIFLFSIKKGFSTDYYVAANGSDLNNGTSPGTAWQTLNKVNSFTNAGTITNGDKIYLHRGDVFRGTLFLEHPANNEIQILAYGTGAKPIISASQIISGWTAFATNIWRAPLTNVPGEVYRAGTILNNARYPDNGYLYVDNATVNSVTSTGIGTSGINWVGGKICLRTLDYIYQDAGITSQTGNTINTQNFSSAAGAGRNFYLFGVYDALSTEGEWYYDAASQYLYIYSATNPSASVIEAAVFNYGVKCSFNRTGIRVEGIEFNHQLQEAVWIAGQCDNTVVANNTFRNLWKGMWVMRNNVTVSGNDFHDIYNNGIAAQNLLNSTITNNYFERIGKRVVATGPEGAGGNLAIYLVNTLGNTVTSYNTITDIGYSGIVFVGTGNIIEKNTVSNFLNTLSDGGGIYTCCTSSSNNIVRQNFVSDKKGDVNGVPNSPGALGGGIYVDNIAQQTTVTQNTVWNMGNNSPGIIVNWESHSNTITNNLVYNAGIGIVLNDIYNATVYGNQVNGNIFYTLDEKAVAVEARSTQNTFNLATYENNYYCNPYSLFSTRRTTGYLDFSKQTLEQWRILEPGNDINTKREPIKMQQHPVRSVTGTEMLGPNTTFNTNVNGWNCFANNGNCATTWDNTAGFSGGALRLTHTSTDIGFAASPVFSITNGQWYQLMCKGKSTGNKDVEIIVKRAYGDFAPIQEITHLPFTDNIQSFSFVFQANVTESPANIIFQTQQGAAPIWLDDVSLMPVNVSTSNPVADNPLLVNATDNTVTQSLTAGSFVDINGVAASPTQTLLPWSSKVFARQAVITLPLQSLFNFSGSYDIAVNASQLSWNTTGEEGLINFELQCSSNATDWAAITNVVPKNTPGTHQYSAQHTNPPPGKVLHRIKIVDRNGEIKYSSIIVLYIGAENRVVIYPNPAATLFTINGKWKPGAILNIFDTQGKRIKSLPLNGQAHQVTTSELSNGQYLITVVNDNGEMLYKNFLIIQK